MARHWAHLQAGRTDRTGQCERRGSKDDTNVCVGRVELPFTKTRETVRGAGMGECVWEVQGALLRTCQI